MARKLFLCNRQDRLTPSVHLVVDGKYLELGTAVDLVSHFLVFFGEGKDEFFVEYVALFKLWILACEALCDCLGT